VSEARAHAELTIGRTHDLREPKRRVPPCLRGGKISSGSERPGGCRSGRAWAWSLLTEGGISGSHKSAAAQTRSERRRIPRVLAWQGDIRGRPRRIHASARHGPPDTPAPERWVRVAAKMHGPACASDSYGSTPAHTLRARALLSWFWRQPALACAANSTNVVANALASVGASRTAGGRPSTTTRTTGTTSGAAREPTSISATSTPRPGADHCNVR
jgi:hypothetical protein